MSAQFPNLYTHRKVAETSSKACDICYKPTTSVLITHDKKVWHEFQWRRSVNAGIETADSAKGLLLRLSCPPEGQILLYSKD